jgi:predicted secreted protein
VRLIKECPTVTYPITWTDDDSRESLRQCENISIIQQKLNLLSRTEIYCKFSRFHVKEYNKVKIFVLSEKACIMTGVPKSPHCDNCNTSNSSVQNWVVAEFFAKWCRMSGPLAPPHE